jgi:hypothetical protein
MMQTKYIFRLITGIVFYCSTGLFAYSMPADTLVQPDTSSVKSDTSHKVDNSVSENIAADYANRLKSQLNLTEEQTDQVRSILSGYVEQHSSSGDTAGISEEIAKVLNDTQRSSWQSVQSSFWSDLNRRIKDDFSDPG